MCTDNAENTRTYTVIQVSKLFGVSESAVKYMIKDGRLDAQKIKNRYQITEESIKRLVREGSEKYDR